MRAGNGGSGGVCVLLGAGLVLPGAGSRGGQVVWGHCDGDRAPYAFFCRAAAAAAGRGEADPGGAGGGGGGVPAVGQQLERGVNRTAHKDTAVLLAGALGLTGPAGELFVAAARGHVPATQVLAAAEGGAAAER